MLHTRQAEICHPPTSRHLPNAQRAFQSDPEAQDYWKSHGVRDFKAEPWQWDPASPGLRTRSGSRKAAALLVFWELKEMPIRGPAILAV